jgi:hypothetical protein
MAVRPNAPSTPRRLSVVVGALDIDVLIDGQIRIFLGN